MFLTLNFIFAQSFLNIICSQSNPVRRVIDQVYLAILGFIVYEKNHKLKDKSSIAIANHISNLDGFTVATFSNYFQLLNVDHGFVVNTALRIVKCSENSEEVIKKISERQRSGDTCIVFPEESVNNGHGLLDFREWPFACQLDVQPIALKSSNLFAISPSTIYSTWWQDLFWAYFSPLTIYTATILPSTKKAADESVTEFKDRVSKSIADELKIKSTAYTAEDIKEYKKKTKYSVPQPQQRMTRGSLFDHRIANMVKQVQEILPRVPAQVIASDLAKTHSVDITVTNLLEGVVKYKELPEQQQPSTSSSSSKVKPQPSQKKFCTNPGIRHLSLQERKMAFIQAAREKYIQKHKLTGV
jgi:ancient ubiquitous protein 1